VKMAAQTVPLMGEKPKFGAPSLDEKNVSDKLARLGELMSGSCGRKEISIKGGWGGTDSIRKKVPTEDAQRSYDQAMTLAREILESSGNPVDLAELRTILNRDPMNDVRDARYMGFPAPLVEDVGAKLASIAVKP
jgi:hypothetical protein